MQEYRAVEKELRIGEMSLAKKTSHETMVERLVRNQEDISFGVRTERALDMEQDRVQDTARALLAAWMDQATVPIPPGR